MDITSPSELVLVLSSLEIQTSNSGLWTSNYRLFYGVMSAPQRIMSVIGPKLKCSPFAKMAEMFDGCMGS